MKRLARSHESFGKGTASAVPSRGNKIPALASEETSCLLRSTNRCALALFLVLASCAAAQTVRIGVFGLFHPKQLEVCPLNQPLTVRVQGSGTSLSPGRCEIPRS